MIGSIRGMVTTLSADHCLLENNGIGYRIFMPVSTLSKLKTGQEIKVFTYMAVREDAILLFGFSTQEYHALFLQLTAVSGIGPKVALGILSSITPEAFYIAIKNRDIKLLTTLPGIGKKTAERLLLEMKDKIGAMDENGFDVSDASSPRTLQSSLNEAIEALRALGYNNGEIYPVVEGLTDVEQMSTENIIRQALKNMGRRKQ